MAVSRQIGESGWTPCLLLLSAVQWWFRSKRKKQEGFYTPKGRGLRLRFIFSLIRRVFLKTLRASPSFADTRSSGTNPASTNRSQPPSSRLSFSFTFDLSLSLSFVKVSLFPTRRCHLSIRSWFELLLAISLSRANESLEGWKQDSFVLTENFD